jgi:hypothetical protein
MTEKRIEEIKHRAVRNSPVEALLTDECIEDIEHNNRQIAELKKHCQDLADGFAKQNEPVSDRLSNEYITLLDYLAQIGL